MAEKWVFLKAAAEHYSVSIPTLRRWADTGKIKSRRTPSNQRQFNISEAPIIPGERTNFIYVRVSSHKQKDDLERQISFLLEQFPYHRVIRDIGSGLNYHRPGFVSLLEQIERNAVGEIVVASKDRLCRFGFELCQWICIQHGTKLLVLEQNDASPEEELSAELLDIVQVFCCRKNGHRRYRNKNPQTAPGPELEPEESAV